MQTWKGIFRESLTRPDDFSSAFALEPFEIEKVLSRYPALVNPYFREICDAAGPSLSRQILPDTQEVSAANDAFPEDPIGEDVFSPVPNLSHRYGDRVLFLVSDICPVYCRFCTRKRKVGRGL
ncbi:MAG: lysine 2,3-aminomutase, partial [Proteobacteria bacterium]|nr:lysine 2,3-aminomutase [Pseudomonadota bacterium]